MNRFLGLFFCLAVLPARTARADSANPMSELSQLEAALSYYDAALEDFKAGRTLNGRARMKGAFSIVASLMTEDKLPTELRADLVSMIEKVRAWEGAEPSSEEAVELDVGAEELASIEARPAQPTPQKPHTIKIDPENPITKKYLEIYSKKRPHSVEEALARSGKDREMILRELRKAGLPEELLWLVMTESEFKRKAVSRSGAGGLWQFMPGTARNYGLEVSYWVDERMNPEKATKAAVRYLKDLHQWFGDWHLALAAYNRGENGIGRDLQFSGSTDFSGLSGRKVLPEETHNYVPKFMACVLIGDSPERFGLKAAFDPPERYEIAEIPKPLDIKIAAKAASISEEALRQLNPELRAWCTPKNKGAYPLRLPPGTKDGFFKFLAGVENWTPGPELARYKVVRGDHLGKIARRFRTTPDSIMKLNGIKNARSLKVGQVLKIRAGKSAE